MAKKTNYDSDFCGSLPLGNINVIQEYGYLMVLEKTSYQIVQVSENFVDILSKPLAEIIGTPLESLVDSSIIEKLTQRGNDNLRDRVPFKLVLAKQQLIAVAHFKEHYVLLELEAFDAAQERSFNQAFENIKYALAAIDQAKSIKELSELAILEIRKMTGFDGIMMYQFDKDWNGTVIAEEKSEGLENYLGHTFPASDVPKQARQLYLQNPYRLIPDRDYRPVRLYPVINPITKVFTELSDCNLRGVAAVHLEYLKNMNVKASMSIRVIHGGQLWGLIACHHLTTNNLSLELCSICELLSSFISNKISSLIAKEKYEQESEIHRRQNTLIAQVYAENDLIDGILNDSKYNLTHVFDAGGSAMVLDGKITAIGDVPDHDFLEDLVLWLQSKGVKQIFHTEHLTQLYEDAAAYADIASGLLVIPLDREKGNYIFCFRPELVQTIKWGGDPNQAINFEPGSKNYHPRNSFSIWQETLRQTSNPWNSHELATAEQLRSFIYEFITRNKD